MEIARGTMINDNVRLLQPLGQGGMGDVWLAEHLGLEAQVAVKVIRTDASRNAEFRERFKREASIGARLRSPHAVQTFDYGVTNQGFPYIVMELLEGSDLTDRIETKGPLPFRRVCVLVNQIANVLERAHGLGIVHRDIKPDNIYLIDADYSLFVKVLDFGIAKFEHAGEGMTKTGVVVGSPEFMSPEQAVASKAVDHRSDLFSLGIVAFYALTGTLPYDLESKTPVWVQITMNDPMPPSKHRSEVTEEVDAWFAKALARKPDERFQSAKVMADELMLLSDTVLTPDLARTVVRNEEDDEPPDSEDIDLSAPQEMTIRMTALEDSNADDTGDHEETQIRAYPDVDPLAESMDRLSQSHDRLSQSHDRLSQSHDQLAMSQDRLLHSGEIAPRHSLAPHEPAPWEAKKKGSNRLTIIGAILAALIVALSAVLIALL